MADESDLELKDEGAELGLRAQVAASEFLLRYWKHLAAAVVLVIVAIAAFGQWRIVQQDAQRSKTAAIADVEAELPSDLLALAQAKAGMRPDVTVEDAKLGEAAGKLVAIASDASGTAAIEAQLKAAELYRISGDAEKRRAALEATAARAEGVLKYAAVAALANLDLEQGKTDEGLARFESLQKEPDAFLARQATLDRANALEALGRPADAVKVYDEYVTRWPQAPDIEDVKSRRQSAQDHAG